MLASNLNILPHVASPLAIFAKIANFRQNRHFHQNRQPLRGHLWYPIQIARGWWFFASFAIFAIACMAIFAKIANFAKIAIFAKIASLQGATFGIQFKSPAAGNFSPVSLFSPLYAFLDISVVSTAERNIKLIWTSRSLFRAAMLFSSTAKTVFINCKLDRKAVVTWHFAVCGLRFAVSHEKRDAKGPLCLTVHLYAVN